MKTLIKNGQLINPKTNFNNITDIMIEDGKVIKISKDIKEEADKIIDAKGCLVTPGLIDVHVHLREPGFEHKETILTGSKSAAKGGFTTICAMPNTSPVIDNEIVTTYVKYKAKEAGIVNVLPIGAITKGQEGKELASIGKMVEAGICAISVDGKSVLNAGLLKKAMTYAKMYDIPVLSHCEDETLAGSGVMNAGETATMLGMKGIPNESEEVIVARDILLGKSTGVKLHICHISTETSVDLIREAKAKGINVTAEVCPHHFTLTEEAVCGYDPNTKMNPPLRTQGDIEALKKGLADGTIEIIATDHAPHHKDEKNCEYDKALNGIVGLETSISLGITELVESKIITIDQLIEKMSLNPAKMLGIDKGSIEEGKDADITIIDPSQEYEININDFVSKSNNSPFHGRKVKGVVTHTIVNGKIVYSI